MNPATLHIMKYFPMEPQQDKEVLQPFSELAAKLDRLLHDGPEKTVALRKLLEAQDAAVRAFKD